MEFESEIKPEIHNSPKDHERDSSPFPVKHSEQIAIEEQKSKNIFPNTDPKMEHSSDYVVAEGYRCARLWQNK